MDVVEGEREKEEIEEDGRRQRRTRWGREIGLAGGRGSREAKRGEMRREEHEVVKQEEGTGRGGDRDLGRRN